MYGYPQNFQPYAAAPTQNFQQPPLDFYQQQIRAAMQQPNPYQTPAPQPQQTQTGQFNVRPVTSVEEAKAAMIDPIGNNLFPDFANNSIYLKKINNNGLAEFYTFTLQSETPKADPIAEINNRLTNIETLIGGLNRVAADVPTATKQNATARPTSVSKSDANDTGKVAG